MTLRFYFKVGGLVAFMLATLACKEKRAVKEVPKSGVAGCDATKDPNCVSSTTPISYSGPIDLCGLINKNPEMAEFAAVTQLICKDGTAGLLSMAATSLYRGGAAATLKDILAQEMANKQSRIQFFGAMQIAPKPRSYFNFMKLQIAQPSTFDQAKFMINGKEDHFETDSKVSYEVKPAVGNGVTYRYKNTTEAPEVVVDYTATARFITLIPEQFYIVSTAKDKNAGGETVLALKGYSIIYASSATTTDVISISDQIYDNNGQHPETLRKARNAAQAEQMRSFRNGQKSDQANALVK